MNAKGAPSPTREALIHLGVVGVALIVAVGVWTRDKPSAAVAPGDVIVWSGRSGDVTRVAFDSKAKKVALEAKTDADGRYFVGSMEKDAPPPPHVADGGAPDAGAASANVGPTGKVTLGLVSMGPGEKLADAVGSLHALRALGKIGPDRAAEFGLAEPDATLSVRVGGVDHALLLGATVPGGNDRYARDPASQEVYVLKGDLVRSLELADSQLLEHESHEWKEAEVQRARLESAGKTRDVVRSGPETKRFWADAATPDATDETLGNWMTKIEHLRPTEFALTEPAGKEVVLRVEYTGKKPLGFLELAKTSGDKVTFYLRTEHTRLWGKIATSSGEQVEQDLGAVIR